MKSIIIIILTLGLLSQGCERKLKNKDIQLFESNLSNENLATLNELVKEFDNYIEKRFQSENSLDSSYKQFLLMACRPYTFVEQKADSLSFQKLKEIFKNSKLEKEIVLKPDTIALIEGNKSLLRIYKYTNRLKKTEEVIQDTFLLPPNPKHVDLTKIDFNSFLEKRNQLRLFNVFGEYYQGLNSIENKSDFIKSYLENKSQVLNHTGRNRFNGFSSFNLMACGILNNNVDLTDYFVKRIIIIELLN